MENSYGVGTSNRFSLFLDEEADPFEILRTQDEEKQKKKAEKPKEKPKNAKAPVKANTTGTKQEKNAAPRSANVSEVATRPPRSNRGPPPRQQDEAIPRGLRRTEDSGEVRDRGGDFDFKRGGRGGVFRGRGGRGGRGRGGGSFDTRNKREFDRQSGSEKSGVKPFEKRDGSGPHNWGSMKDELDRGQMSVEEGDKTVTEEGVTGEGGENKEGGAGGEEKEAGEEAVPEMTLDEYKKQQQKARSVAHFKIRKPGEGENNEAWNKTYKLKKELEEQSEEYEEEELEEDTRRHKQKPLLDIKLTFMDSKQRGGRGRGGRGRGGMGRGEERKERHPPQQQQQQQQQQTPRVDNWDDFPSLITAS